MIAHMNDCSYNNSHVFACQALIFIFSKLNSCDYRGQLRKETRGLSPLVALWYNDCVAVIIIGSRGKKHKVSLCSLLYGIINIIV